MRLFVFVSPTVCMGSGRCLNWPYFLFYLKSESFDLLCSNQAQGASHLEYNWPPLTEHDQITCHRVPAYKEKIKRAKKCEIVNISTLFSRLKCHDLNTKLNLHGF
jgi:hypothetical protein